MSSESSDDQEQTQTAPLTALVTSLQVSDRIALAALATAVIAGLIGVIQTAFMWDARNDESEAALRAQQLRACVNYRSTAVALNTRAQIYAAERVTPDKDELDAFEEGLGAYQDSISELSYLLPASAHGALDGVEVQAIAAYSAFVEEDFGKLADIANAQSPWAQAHDGVLEQCEEVVRHARDN